MAIQMLVCAHLEPARRASVLGVAAHREALVDVDRHAAHGVDEIAQTVDVEQQEVVHGQAGDALHTLLQRLSPAVRLTFEQVGVVAISALPNGVEVPLSGVALAAEPVGEFFRHLAAFGEGRVLQIAGDLDERGGARGGVDACEYHRVGAEPGALFHATGNAPFVQVGANQHDIQTFEVAKRILSAAVQRRLRV